MGKKFKINILIYIIIIILLLIFCFCILSKFLINKNIDKTLNNPNIYDNIFVNNIDLSNLSKEQAIQKLKENIKINQKVILRYKDKEFSYNKNDIGFEIDFEKIIEQAYNIARIGDKNTRYEEILELKKVPKNLPILFKFNEKNAISKIEELEKIINKEPIKSRVIKNNNKFDIIKGENGFILNREKLLNLLQSNIDKNTDIIIDIPMEEIIEDNTEDLKMIKHKLGGYKTKYTGSQDSNRVINMKVAANNINGTILYPNEIFSTNKAFKKTTKENGYKPAKTIINGKFVDEYGGGVCQVSSTLYNAILFSELDIVERKNHSLKVGYLDYGYDATLAGDYIDLKFKNSTDYPIYIEAYLTNNEVICNIYGYDERPKNRTLKFENTLVKEIPPGPRIEKETMDLAIGEEKVEIKALNGYKYKLYKLVYIDGKLTEKILVNDSYYKPRCEEVLIGANKDLSKPVSNNNDKPLEDIKKPEKNIQKNEENTEILTDNKQTTETIEITEITETTETIKETELAEEINTNTELIEEIINTENTIKNITEETT